MNGPPTALEPGEFCRCELETVHVPGARRFYGGLFGWRAREEPAGPRGGFTLFSLDGCEVARASVPGGEPAAAARWLSFVLCTDAERDTGAAADLGGRVVVAPTAVPGMGRFAVVTDPRGTPIALWQDAAAPAPWPRTPGQPCWFELNTTTPEAADFYCRLFGWRAESRTYDQDYTVFFKGRRAVASAALVTDPAAADHWLPYFAVADCDAALDQAVALGATVAAPCRPVPGLGSYGVVADPGGAAFAVKQNL